MDLLERGASCKVVNKRGETPLHFAALLDSDNLAGKVIARGSNLNAKDIDGLTALEKAIRYKKQACIVLLQEKSGHV